MLPECYIVDAIEIVCGSTKSPEEKLFKQYKETFEELDMTELENFPWESDEMSQIDPYKFTTKIALEVQNWAEDKVRVRGSFPRENYRELLKLITHILGKVI